MPPNVVPEYPPAYKSLIHITLAASTVLGSAPLSKLFIPHGPRPHHMLGGIEINTIPYRPVRFSVVLRFPYTSCPGEGEKGVQLKWALQWS